MEWVVRAIKTEDFEQLLALFQEFAKFEQQADKMLNTLERMHLEKNFINGFVAENQEHVIVGFVTYFFAYYTWSGKSLYMDDLYVHPNYRGKGLGTLLFNKVVAHAKTNNCHKLRWQVSNWNESAIRFYKSKGASIDTIEQNCDLIIT